MAIFGRFWPFLVVFGIFPLKNIGFFIFFYTAANFTLMCLRNNKIIFGTRRLRKCYWFSKFQVERFLTIFGPFLAVLGIFPPKYVGIFTFYCIATYLICMSLRINKKNLGSKPFGPQVRHFLPFSLYQHHLWTPVTRGPCG